MKAPYEKLAVVRTEVDVSIDGFDHKDKPITIKFRAGAYYDTHSLTYNDNTYVDILLSSGEIFPRVNRKKVGLTYIGKPQIHDNRTTEQKISWAKGLADIDEKSRKRNDKKPIAPKTIHLNKTEKPEAKSKSSWFTKSDNK